MRFYTQQHRYYCGIDLHARRMYVCILDQSGEILVHRNGPTTPEHFLAVIKPYREDVAVSVECMFSSLISAPARPSPSFSATPST